MNNKNKTLIKQLEKKLKCDLCFELDQGIDLMNVVLHILNENPRKCIALLEGR